MKIVLTVFVERCRYWSMTDVLVAWADLGGLRQKNFASSIWLLMTAPFSKGKARGDVRLHTGLLACCTPVLIFGYSDMFPRYPSWGL